MSRWAAIVAGGSGTRFWPLSTPSHPKQLLPLASAVPLIRDAVDRLAAFAPPERILIVTAERLVAATQAALPHLPRDNFLGEPRAASTGPALAWATAVAQSRDPHATILAQHADWYVGNATAFCACAARACEVAEQHDILVTVGIVPTRPETGYGYIEPGDVLDGEARQVRRFTEKPNLARATELLEGGALWNSGLFAWTATAFDRETAAVAPEIWSAHADLAAGRIAAFFEHVQPIAIDVSHFERSTRVAVLPGDFAWDDVGTWSALGRVRPADAHGNVTVGPVYPRDTVGCVAWTDDGPVVLDGVRDLVVVRAHGTTLVTTAARAAQLKELLATLPSDLVDPPDV